MLDFEPMREIRQFAASGADYTLAWQLRKEVLLDPFGIDHDAARGDDASAFHFGLFDESGCLACLFLVQRRATDLQMRQVAVRPLLKGQGLGRQLLEAAEDFARRNGFSLLFAHARATALPFYLRLGYEVRGEPFLQVGLPHHLVEKGLSP